MARIRSISVAGLIGSLAALTAALAGCRGSTSANIREDTARRVTFTRDVAPIALATIACSNDTLVPSAKNSTFEKVVLVSKRVAVKVTVGFGG